MVAHGDERTEFEFFNGKRFEFTHRTSEELEKAVYCQYLHIYNEIDPT